MRALLIVLALGTGCMDANEDSQRPYGLFEVRRVEYGFHAGPALVWPERFQLALSNRGAEPIGDNVIDATIHDYEPEWLLVHIRERWSSPSANIGLVGVDYELAVVNDSGLTGIAKTLMRVGDTRVEVSFNVTAARVAP
jgi:hypothetical protein